ncbi:transcriptional regulator, TetR family [Anaerolinea thermolimosa]|uniref:TetR/AcrR family transcriptional regulator n=1 Tax=Anaerolinea thermolimosa TaxID=229919 RepID=UPI00078279B5|nr:TetR/AcrR family transcriptional regulator [Anaerolinea thermolimosa]GAP05447.1 transcriptional regulator, TetR family [Anaerolinea thermolimosa]
MPRKTGLNRETIVEAAVELVNREGVGALTLHRLAAHVGVRPPSLYNHIHGMPGLLRELALFNARQLAEQMGRAVIGQSGAPALEKLANVYRAYIKANPGLYWISLSAPQPEDDIELIEAQQDIIQIALLVIESLGYQGEQALHIVRGLQSLVHGFTTLENLGGFGLELDCEVSFQYIVSTFIRGISH